MRFLVVHLPAFRLERCGYGAEDLAGLIAEQRSALRVVALTPASRREGLRLGMTATEARARLPEVELFPVDPHEESRDWRALVHAFMVWSDRVWAPWPDALVAEVGSTARALGGEEAVWRGAVARAEALGHRARAAIADDPVAARALAVWGRGGVVPSGLGAERLAELPIEALDPPAAIRQGLRAVGVERIGQLAALPPASVASRFGQEGAALQVVARGGCATPWVAPAADDPTPAASAPLGGVTRTLELHAALPGLFASLSEALAERGLAAVRVRLVLELERREGLPPAIGVGLRVGRPTRCPQTLERLARVRLDGLSLPAPAESLRVEAVEVAPDHGWQPGLTDRREATEPLPDLLARLADQLGASALCGAALVEAWRPESAWAPTPWPPAPVRAPQPADDPVFAQQAFEREQAWPRPTLLLPEPVPIGVRCEGERPVAVRGPEGWSPVLRAEGPERLCGAWWAAERWARDYWVLDCAGSLAWCFRALNAPSADAWRLHGYFD